MSRAPSSSRMRSRLTASIPISWSNRTRAGRVAKWSIETRTAPRRSLSYLPSGARSTTTMSWRYAPTSSVTTTHGDNTL